LILGDQASQLRIVLGYGGALRISRKHWQWLTQENTGETIKLRTRRILSARSFMIPPVLFISAIAILSKKNFFHQF
jgi:hypothetical protein